MSEHVTFREMRPEDVKMITFGEPGWLIDRVGRPDVIARVAIFDGRIVGYAVSWLAVVHRTRRFIDVEIHPDSRGRRIGTRLVRQIQQVAPRPLATKALAGSEAEEFIRSLGGRPYAICPPLELPRRHFVRAGEELERRGADSGHAVSGAALAPGALETLWEQMYVWMHAAWSPVDDSEAAHAALRQELDDLDAEASRVVLVGGRPAAVAFVFLDENPTVVAETVEPEVPDGDALVASAILAVIDWADGVGYRRINFDGHRSDPHFGPLAASLPLEGTDLMLLEVPVPEEEQPAAGQDELVAGQDEPMAGEQPTPDQGPASEASRN